MRERISALEAELQDMPAGAERADTEVALAQVWGASGQPQRAAALFRAAYITRKKLGGPQDAGAVNAGLSAAAALRVAGQPWEAWKLAQSLEKAVAPGHAERAHVVAVYNELRPPGFRPASAGGRAAQKTKKTQRKKTKRRR